MMLRLVLIASLFAAITTMVFAAPPRFSGFEPPRLPTPEKSETTPVSPEQKPSAQSSVNNQNDGKQEEKPQPDSQSTAMLSNKPDKTETKKREPLIRWRPSQAKPKERSYKPEEALIPTEQYHKQEPEQIGAANLHQFQAGYQSFWKVNSTKVLCQMTQQIPHYGKVEFRQGVGQPLQFALHVENPPAGVGRARFRTEPPQWQHFSASRDLGVIQLESGERAVAAPADWSRRLFLELSDGMQPVLSYWDAADGTDDIEVMLSAMNFQNSLDLFNRCVGNLLRYDFKSARRTIVYFHPDSSKLRAKATRQLDDVLELLRDDRGIKQVDIEMYTVDKGLVRYNFRLATRRARAVRDYLIKRGIDEDKLLIKIHTMKHKKLKAIGYKTSDVHVVLRRKVVK